MASLSVARQSQSNAAQSNDDAPAPGDPLQPLRTMADRVGKEVEKFAERLDHWHTHGNDNKQTKYQSTVRLVGKYKDYAETQIKDLKRAHDDEHKGELQRSVRRKVQDMADAPDADAQSMFASSALSRPSNTAQASKQLDEIRQWQAELATWELARIMIEQRYPEPLTDAAAAKQERLAATGGNKRYSKNSDVWDRFLLEDDEAKEKALVLRWLEETARRDRSDLDSITTELEKQSGRGAHTWTSGWLDTKSKIKQAKRLEASAGPLKPDGAKLTTADGTQPLVTQLDPDAPARQRRHLERPDEYYERALWMVCYEMLRRGMPWNQICEWSQDRNEAWRGVSVGAACEAHPNGGPNLAGPTAGYLFRRMCFYASRGARSPYEGAVYGLLSGDAKLAQAACRTWDDHLHAHYNALLLSRFDTYLQQDHAGCPARVNQSLAQKFVFQDAVAKLGGWDDASQRVIGLLSQQKSTASEAVEPLKLIQGALISGTIPELLLKVGTGIADMLQADERPNNLMMHPDCDQDKYGPKPKGEGRAFPAERHHQALVSDPHAFRILVHIFIAFRNGLFSDELTAMSKRIPEWMATDNVIAAYIEFLRCAKKYTLIPLYAAQLSHTRIIHCMARVLPDIKNQEEQRQCIDNMMMYRIDIIDPISQSILFAQKNAGLTHFNVEMDTIITEPITRFKILEEAKPSDDSPWPGYRIRQGFEGSPIGAEEDAIVEALQWLQYTANDYEQTFAHLKSSMTILLLKGRLTAAEALLNELSVESLSLTRTEAYCGYPFDFTHPEAIEQNENALYEHRKSYIGTKYALPREQLPGPDKHAALVQDLRDNSAGYFQLQTIVRMLAMFREWRDEEAKVIEAHKEQAKQDGDAAQHKKHDMTHIKDLLEAIEVVFHVLISTITANTHDHTQTDPENSYKVLCAYIPEIVLAYLAVLHTAATFLKRETAAALVVKAMDVATLVADDENGWLQQVFVDTKRMRELVDALAQISKFMLRLGEFEPKKSGLVKKRGSKGETLRIWDLNARERV